MPVSELEGLKYPDEYVVKFFFKNYLDKRTGKALEIGCGNGSNLMLFADYGWEVVGIDILEKRIAAARKNFKKCYNSETGYQLITADVTTDLKIDTSCSFDVILFPSVLYYLSRSDMQSCLKQVAPLAANGAFIFVRMRTMHDFRYGMGAMVEKNSFVLSTNATGEKDEVNTFYSEHELLQSFDDHFHFDSESIATLYTTYDNIQHGMTIHNADIIFCGRCCF
ncbi:MAG: class I SAM-dependent methyltransferase [Desulfovibrionaceae bacterium]